MGPIHKFVSARWGRPGWGKPLVERRELDESGS